MLNRDLLIVKLKQPFVDWVNEADPYPEAGSHITLEAANEDSPAFLIHDLASDNFDDWMAQCYLLVFESILEEWYADESLWPQDRTLSLFQAWCDCEVHSVIFDLVDEPLEDDEFYD